MGLRDYRVRDYRDRIKCKWCEKEFAPLVRYCPFCGHSNEDFFKYALHGEAQQFVELWMDRDVYRAVVELAKERGAKIPVVIQDAVEHYITALSKK